MRLPPVSKFSVISLLIFSTSVAFYRYYTYFVLVSHTNQSSKQPTPDQSYPEDPALKIPRPDEIYVPLLTLVPPSGTSWAVSEDSTTLKTNGITFYPWVLVTSSLVETNIIPFLLAFITLLYGARYCENVWGSIELTRFLVIMSVVPNLFVYSFYTFMHWLLYRNRKSDEDPSFDSFKETICGTAAVVAGFLVAFKQLVPEHMIVMFKGRIRIRVKRLPFLFIITNTLAGILGYDLVAIMSWVGFMTSWIYLRFIRISYVDPLLPFSLTTLSSASPSSSAGTGNSATTSSSSSSTNPSSISSFFSLSSPNGVKIRGDASDSFALSTFFPEPFSLIVEMISESIFRLFVTLHIIRPFTLEEVDNANSRAIARLVPGGISGPSTRTFQHQHLHRQQTPTSFLSNPFDSHSSHKYPRGSTRAEAERRRSLALRALNQDLPLPPTQLTTPTPVVLPAPRAGKD